ncbi:pyridoxal-phosphate dependent enzyme [Clostridia bacterium]|nr:pyridoxal-phosphate dependent enzyme [Clostridia bacterium]
MIKPNKTIFPLLETPIQDLPTLSSKTGVKLSIKRDDLNGIGLGGNKIRKLAYLIQDAKDKGATRLLTTGGVQTNHGRLTAAIAAMFEMKCTLVLVGEEPSQYSGNLILDQIFGADLIFTTPENLELTIDKACEQSERAGESVYTIPLGGSSPLGLLGYVEAAKEIHQQLERQHKSVDYIVTAYGSGGTYGGLLLGAKRLGDPFEILGMNVLSNPADRQIVHDSLLSLLADTAEEFSLEQKIKESDLRITMESVGPGYNHPDTTTVETVLTVARAEGIMLDYCYTGKAFDCMLKQIESGIIAQGSRVLFLHTGGNPALFSNSSMLALEEYLSNK